jgi:hypothetical protein
MSKREHRRFTAEQQAEQQLEILREADQAGVSVSETCPGVTDWYPRYFIDGGR